MGRTDSGRQERLAATPTVFLHYYGTGPAAKLAQAVRSAVDQLGRHNPVNSHRPNMRVSVVLGVAMIALNNRRAVRRYSDVLVSALSDGV